MHAEFPTAAIAPSRIVAICSRFASPHHPFEATLLGHAQQGSQAQVTLELQ
jgi:hypothetical protein